MGAKLDKTTTRRAQKPDAASPQYQKFIHPYFRIPENFILPKKFQKIPFLTKGGKKKPGAAAPLHVGRKRKRSIQNSVLLNLGQGYLY